MSLEGKLERVRRLLIEAKDYTWDGSTTGKLIDEAITVIDESIAVIEDPERVAIKFEEGIDDLPL